MGDWQGGGESRERTAERARSVALDYQQGRPIAQQRRYRPGNPFGMVARIAQARAIERHALKAAQAMLGGSKRMLAGQDQSGLQPAANEGRRDRRQLDCFWTCSDHKVDTIYRQPSP
jgi:hypothetical protein